MATEGLFEEAGGLNRDQFLRYGRQMLLPEIGLSGQKSLLNATVIIVGAGGLGSPAALYLAGAGIGTLVIVDGDVIQLDNLHRQVIYTTAKIHRPKVDVAKEVCEALNPRVCLAPAPSDLFQINIIKVDEELGPDNVDRIIWKVDAVLDCTDNAKTRYLLNKACARQGIPLIAGSALQFQGQLSIYCATGGPCYSCVFPAPPENAVANSCDLFGVIGPAPGIIGVMQACETIKLLCPKLQHTALIGRLLIMDLLNVETPFRVLKLRARPVGGCAACRDGESAGCGYAPPHPWPAAAWYSPCPPLLRRIFDDHFTVVERPNKIKFLAVKKLSAVIDVRRDSHEALLPLRGAAHFSLETLKRILADDELRAGFLETFLAARNGEIFLVCRKGRDALKAAELLRTAQLPTPTGEHIENSDRSTVATITGTDNASATLKYTVIEGGLVAMQKHIPELRDYPIF